MITNALVSLVGLLVFLPTFLTLAGEQPIAIFHAHDEEYKNVAEYVCKLAAQGYSHIQIAPAQKSNPNPDWWARYQPVQYAAIEGRGSQEDLRFLLQKAHSCNVKVIADVVFNHMANLSEFANLDFPEFDREDFHARCPINYNDGNTWQERNCWLGGDLPDLNQSRPDVHEVQTKHLKTLLDLGIDGFRFDAAKHMEPVHVREYIEYIDTVSRGKTWNYLEVIEDADTRADNYNSIAAVTDFRLCNTLLGAFAGGDLRSLQVSNALNDSRRVTFGRNHDTARDLNNEPPSCGYYDAGNAHLATAYVLARESGTPLILGKDNLNIRYIPSGVKFRQIMKEQGKLGLNVKENVLRVIDNRDVLIMERGSEGFFVVNKGEAFDIPVLDLTLTNLEGCYRELTNNFTVAIEKRGSQKFVTRWGTWKRGGLEIYGREALYLIREPFEVCTGST